MKMLILGEMAWRDICLFSTSGFPASIMSLHDPDRCDPQGLVLDVTDMSAVEHMVKAVLPDLIINAVGVLNQRAEEDKINAYHINGFLPHRLRYLADSISARLIHISTDCVFWEAKEAIGKMIFPMA